MILRNLVIVVTILVAMLVIGCATPVSEESQQAPPTLPAAPPPSAPPAEMPQTELKLTITEPVENSIVSNGVVSVKGKTSPGAVVSINGEMTSADSLGNFTVKIVLEEGPNVIEVIASDEYGNEATATLTVVLMKGE